MNISRDPVSSALVYAAWVLSSTSLLIGSALVQAAPEPVEELIPIEEKIEDTAYYIPVPGDSYVFVGLDMGVLGKDISSAIGYDPVLEIHCPTEENLYVALKLDYDPTTKKVVLVASLVKKVGDKVVNTLCTETRPEDLSGRLADAANATTDRPPREASVFVVPSANQTDLQVREVPFLRVGNEIYGVTTFISKDRELIEKLVPIPDVYFLFEWNFLNLK